MEISSKMVADLRSETGVGMMECKKALVEARGDFEEARKVLRKKGLAAAASKAGRATSEGLVVAHAEARCVVDQNVDATQCRRRGRYPGSDGRGVGEVAGHGVDASAMACDLRARRLQRRNNRALV